MLTANDFGTKRTQNGDQLSGAAGRPRPVGLTGCCTGRVRRPFPTDQRRRLVQRLRAPHSGALTVASPDRPRPGGIDTTCTVLAAA